MPHPAGIVASTVARTRVKICGITRPQDGVVAAHAGADAIGLVFYAASPRAVTVEQARSILQALPPFVTTVGLFVNATVESVRTVLQEVHLDLLQFHGDETPAYCSSFGKPWLKAIRVRQDTDLAQEISAYASAKGILLDAWHEGIYGGTGQRFDWQRLQQLDAAQCNSRQSNEAGAETVTRALPIILAGGLAPANVAQAIATARPWGVDVSSGVESSPGIKAAELITAFMQEVQRV